MKFTEEQAYDEIIAKLKKEEANPLFNERGIKAMIKRDFMMLKDSEMELDAYASDASILAKDIDGNIRKVVSTSIESSNKTAVEKALEDYKKQVNPQDDKKDINDGLSAFEQRLKVLEDENARLKEESGKTETRTSIVAAFKEKGISDEDWINEMLEFANYDNGTDIASYVDKGVKLFNRQKSQTSTFTPNRTEGATGGVSALAKAAMKIKKNAN